MWHKMDWEKVKADPTLIQFLREDWVFLHDAEGHAEQVGDDAIKKAGTVTAMR